MFRSIIGTIFSKGLTAISNLATLLITAKFLGAYGRGEMVIILLGITIVGVFQNIFSGAVLTYLIPRFSFRKLLVISGIWNVLMAATLPFALVYTDLFPAHYLKDLIYLSFTLGMIAQIQSSLIGFEKILKQNIIEISRAVTLAFFLLLFIVIYKDFSIDSVITSLYYSYFTTLFIALVFISPLVIQGSSPANPYKKNIFSQFLKIGFQMQLNNISQMINYRFCYYLIEKVLGLAALGIFSVATSLVEVIWIISRSISMIHYSKSVNLKDESKQVRLTQKLAIMSFTLTVPSLVILFLLPNELFSFVLGNEFNNFKPLFLTLSPGVLLLATFTILNHHFSGVEKNIVNVKASLIGNVITIIVGLLTIHAFGILAGGIATSMGYLGMFIYLFWKFNHDYQLSNGWFALSKRKVKESFNLKEFEAH